MTATVTNTDPPAGQPERTCVACVGDSTDPATGQPCLRCHGTAIDPDPLAPVVDGAR